MLQRTSLKVAAFFSVLAGTPAASDASFFSLLAVPSLPFDESWGAAPSGAESCAVFSVISASTAAVSAVGCGCCSTAQSPDSIFTIPLPSGLSENLKVGR
uniref:Putative secreted protein n=1 Tax=Ixodes ricinus TaxID=34613 RepID=A0A6B0UGM0_IXORI